MRSIGSSDLFEPSSANLGGISARAREVIDTTAILHGSFNLPPLPWLFINLRYGSS